MIILIALAGCSAQPKKVMTAEWASQKHSDAPDTTRLKKVGFVNEEFCVKSWSGDYGLVDEALKKIHDIHKVDYVKHATMMVTVETKCASVSGDAYQY